VLIPKFKAPWLPAILLSLVLAAASSCNSGYGGKGGYPTGPGTPRELDSGNIGSGGTFAHRFVAAGTYAYHCTYHGPMRGSVSVTASAADTLANVSITSSTTGFPAASVKPGGRVVWTNNDGMVHTVTSD